MKKMWSLLKKNLVLGNKILEILPNWSLKNKLVCFYINYFKKADFKLYYKENNFFVVFKDFSIFYPKNPYATLSIQIKGYLRKYSIKKGDIVIDAGAYDGLFSLMASKIVGDNGKIIAFEPDIVNYKRLLNNIKLNNITNIITVNKGVWSKNTNLQLDNKADLSSFIFGKTKSKHIISVPVVKLDDELKKLMINRVDFIKMDVEGAEIEAIKGCKKTLKDNDIKLAIASYHIVNGKKTCFELEKLFSKLGYAATTPIQPHLTTYANH